MDSNYEYQDKDDPNIVVNVSYFLAGFIFGAITSTLDIDAKAFCLDDIILTSSFGSIGGLIIAGSSYLLNQSIKKEKKKKRVSYDHYQIGFVKGGINYTLGLGLGFTFGSSIKYFK